MSNRTICEFNHDFAYEIARKPELFVELLGHALRSGDADDWEELQLQFGLTKFIMRHHSDDGEIKIGAFRVAIP